MHYMCNKLLLIKIMHLHCSHMLININYNSNYIITTHRYINKRTPTATYTYSMYVSTK